MQEAFNKATNLLGRVDTTLLYQPFLERINTLLNACAARGQLYVATSGYRSYEQQEELYAQGRTKPGKQVTKARGGQSAHNFGLAVDFAPHMADEYVGKLVLGPKDDGYADEYFQILDEETQKLGLDWGGKWNRIHDTPHVQHAGLNLPGLHNLYMQGGIPFVWGFLDKAKRR